MKIDMSNIKVGLVEDHWLMREGLCILIESIGCSVNLVRSNGSEFITDLTVNDLPDVVFIDINIKGMDCFETTSWLQQNHPSIKVLVLSMDSAENQMIDIVKCGGKGYIFKAAEHHEFKKAIKSVIKGNSYSPDLKDYKNYHHLISSRRIDQSE